MSKEAQEQKKLRKEEQSQKIDEEEGAGTN